MKRVNKEVAIIGFIILMALIVRLWGMSYDLPYIYHPDEPKYITISQNIFKTGDLNPHFFNYPSLFFYVNALAYIPYYFLGKIAGNFQTPDDILPPDLLVIGVSQVQMPTTVMLGRIVTIVFGVGVVALVYLVGKQITGRSIVGILGAFMVAVSPTNVWHSRFVTPDTFVTFFATATLLASFLVYKQGKSWQYVVAGICVGLTASSKYNGGLVLLILLLAHFLRYGKGALKQPKLYLALFFCGVGFFVTTPYALLDMSKFLDDLRYEASHYSSGHIGMEGNSLGWYLDYMWNTGGGLYLLAAFGILYGFVSRPKESSLLAIFPLVYFIFIGSFVVRNHRTLLPLTPFLFLAAAWFLIIIFDKLKTLPNVSVRRISLVVLAGIVFVILGNQFSLTVSDTRSLTIVDSRETARNWIDDNLPQGTTIAIEAYSPFVEPARYSVQGYWRMIDHEPEWYIENGFDYLVFSEGMYGRFYLEPEKYSVEVSQYDGFFNRFALTKMFHDGNYEVRIYKVE